MKDVVRRYQERWNGNMMADYCWLIARNNSIEQTRASRRYYFYGKWKMATEEFKCTLPSRVTRVNFISCTFKFAREFVLLVCFISVFFGIVILGIKSEI